MIYYATSTSSDLSSRSNFEMPKSVESDFPKSRIAKVKLEQQAETERLVPQIFKRRQTTPD